VKRSSATCHTEACYDSHSWGSHHVVGGFVFVHGPRLSQASVAETTWIRDRGHRHQQDFPAFIASCPYQNFWSRSSVSWINAPMPKTPASADNGRRLHLAAYGVKSTSCLVSFLFSLHWNPRQPDSYAIFDLLLIFTETLPRRHFPGAPKRLIGGDLKNIPDASGHFIIILRTISTQVCSMMLGEQGLPSKSYPIFTLSNGCPVDSRKSQNRSSLCTMASSALSCKYQPIQWTLPCNRTFKTSLGECP